jgi:hypothetical protein
VLPCSFHAFCPDQSNDELQVTNLQEFHDRVDERNKLIKMLDETYNELHGLETSNVDFSGHHIARRKRVRKFVSILLH